MERKESQSLLALQRGLTGDRNLAGSAYMDDPAMLSAYVDYYRHVSRAQVLRICSLVGLHPESVLDIGAGPGSVSLALSELGARRFHLVDASALALESASEALASLAQAARESFSVSTSVADIESPEALPVGLFGIAVFGHCLNEIGRGEDRIARRLAIVERAGASLSPDGSIMILEPATLAASRDALALRDALVANGWRVLAPCSFGGPCPALRAGPNHTCHDEATWNVPPGVQRLAEESGLDRDLIKMSWLLVVPPLVVPPLVVPPLVVPPVGVLSSVPVPTSSAAAQAYRVVSAPMLNKGGRVRYLICGPGGRFPFSARKDDEAARQAGFFSLGRYDLIHIHEPEIREGGWGFATNTRINKASALVGNEG
ncbi:MAG: small ribosomal subunit Rsm22 family protein [Spirochaetia bacterium]|jgi:SAM-dependent methyltransferase|nr:small ribosomal subunit Rsm22 family protein [Spirochaetia bacterium]